MKERHKVFVTLAEGGTPKLRNRNQREAYHNFRKIVLCERMPSISLGHYDQLPVTLIDDMIQVLALIEQKRNKKPSSISTQGHGRTRRS